MKITVNALLLTVAISTSSLAHNPESGNKSSSEVSEVHGRALLEADYYIQNVARPDMCISAESIIGKDTGKLFYNGRLQTDTCERYAPNQQWHFKPVGLDNGTISYNVNITNVANLTHLETKLNVMLMGQFVWYWPRPVTLVPVDNTPPINGSAYFIKDTSSEFCYQSEEEHVRRTPCVLGEQAQEWRLAIVTFGEIHS